MDEATATEVVDRLRALRIFASVNRRVGVYNVGVRVVIPDGREAIWDNDGASGLEAMVLRDGVLVGFVPQIPDSDDLDAQAITEIISAADYDSSAAPRSQPPSAPAQSSAPSAPATPSAPSAPTPEPPTAPPTPAAAPAAAPAAKPGWWDRLRRGRVG
jgi:hypothetical protein